jgi:hypothetical protein
MYRQCWRLKKHLLTPNVLAKIRSAAFALLLFGTAVRAIFFVLRLEEGKPLGVIFTAIVAALVVLACSVEFLTRRSGARPELRDVYEIRKALRRLDLFRGDARGASSLAELKRLFDDVVGDTLTLACKALRQSSSVRISVMLPSEEPSGEALCIDHIFPASPPNAPPLVRKSFPLPKKGSVSAPAGDIGAAGYAYLGGDYAVYVPWTRNRFGYWVVPVVNGDLAYNEIGAIWVPDTPPELLKSLLAVPIVVDERDTLQPWGVINYGSLKRDAFGGADTYVCIVFASILAQAFSITTSASHRFGAPSPGHSASSP